VKTVRALDHAATAIGKRQMDSNNETILLHGVCSKYFRSEAMDCDISFANAGGYITRHPHISRPRRCCLFRAKRFKIIGA
jgi:hypothetical protein